MERFRRALVDFKDRRFGELYSRSYKLMYREDWEVMLNDIMRVQDKLVEVHILIMSEVDSREF